uniref:KCNQ_channel domain-containing protein n=1 Tax=Rhabditophanes sp. KR3021 TaxID=114890 RepID=A0AC35UEH9_9BILA
MDASRFRNISERKVTKLSWKGRVYNFLERPKGYGDVLIVTWPGRVVASCFAIFAISFFALPAGILGSGFALEVQQKQRKKHFSRKMAPAATLIQTCWRCYAADKSNRYSATWAIYVKPQQKKDDDDLGKNNGGNTDNKVTNRKQNKFFKKAGSNFNVFQKYQSSTATASDEADKKKDIKKKASLIDSKSEEQENEMEESLLALPLSFAHVNELTEVHKNVIRAIRKIKYFVARRGFQQIKKPYDIRDIIEQYSQGHINMMARIKELQRRLDQTLGKTGHQLNNGKRIQSTTIGSRITRLNSLDHKLDNCQHIMQSVCRMLQQDRLPPRHSLPTYGLSGPPLLIHDSTNYQDPESMHQSMSSLAPSMAESVSISIANSPKSSMGGESNTYKLTEFPSSEGECSNSSRCRVNSE